MSARAWMRRAIAIAVLSVWSGPAAATEDREPAADHVVPACLAWRDHLEFSVAMVSRTWPMPAEDIADLHFEVFRISMMCERDLAEPALRRAAALAYLIAHESERLSRDADDEQ